MKHTIHLDRESMNGAISFLTRTESQGFYSDWTENSIKSDVVRFLNTVIKEDSSGQYNSFSSTGGLTLLFYWEDDERTHGTLEFLIDAKRADTAKPSSKLHGYAVNIESIPGVIIDYY